MPCLENVLLKISFENCLVAPTFTKELRDVTLKHGNPLKLDIVVMGIPKPSLRWFKDDQLLDEGDFIMELKDKTHSIAVSQASHEHSGTYKVVAENAAGKVETVSVVAIQTKPQITKPDDVKMVAGTEFLVPITIEGNPAPKIKWMKDKVELPDSLGIKIDKRENVYFMSLNESHTDLTGNYSVTASNPAGTETVNFKVMILGKSL